MKKGDEEEIPGDGTIVDASTLEKPAAAKSVSLTQLFRYADRLDVMLMVLGSLGAMGLGAAMPLLSLLFGQLTNAFGQNAYDVDKTAEEVSKVALKFVWVAIGAAVAAYLEMACWMLTGERQASRIRSLYLRTVLRQEVAFFDTSTSTGEVVGHMSGDMVTVQEAMGEKVGQFIRFSSTFIGGLAIAFAKGWLLTLIMTATLPLLATCGAVMVLILKKLTTRGQEAYAEAGAVAEQCLGGIRTVASFAAEPRVVSKYNESLNTAYHMSVYQSMATGGGMGCTMLVMFCSYALALFVGTQFIADGTYTGGSVMSVLFGVIIGGMSLGQAAPNLAAFASGQAAAFKIFQVIDRTPEIDSGDLSGEILEEVKGEIQLQDVVFRYPARPDVTIFDGLSLSIPAGSTMALVGESGSGKSTIVSLIERFYDPHSGSVLLDGIDIRSLQLRWLRSRIGLVSQEPILFSGTILDNILYGLETGGEEGSAREEKAIEAAKMASIHDFIASLPKGYATEVGERGAQMSGGQKQRVAIARALVRDPDIMLLDEATSALDAESERAVQEALDNAIGGAGGGRRRTTVVVAHRLSTVAGADKIAVIQRGRVVETGTHNELLSRSEGAYSQLVRLQTVKKSGKSNSHKSLAALDSMLSFPSTKPPGYSALDSEEEDEKEGKGTAEGEDESSREGSSVSDSLMRKIGLSFLGKKKSLGGGSKVLGVDAEAGEVARKGGEQVTEKRQRKTKKRDVSFSRVALLNRPEWPVLFVATCAACAQGLMFPSFSLIFSNIIKTFYDPDVEQVKSGGAFWAGMFAVLGVASLVLIFTQMSLFGWAGSKLVRRIRRLCFASVLRQEMAWFDDKENSSGAISARLSTDAAQARGMVCDRLAILFQNIATIVAGLALAFAANWQMSLVVLSVVPLFMFSGAMQMRALKGFSEDAKVMYEDASCVATDAVSSIRTVAAFSAEDHVMDQFEEKCRIPIQAGMRKGHVSGLGLGFGNFVIFAIYGLAFWYGGQLVKERKANFKDVFQVFFAIVMSAMGVSQSSGFAPDITQVQIALNSIFKILDRRSKIDPQAPGDTLPVVLGQIELKDVYFKYPSRPHMRVLRGVSLSIPAGKTVALVGESGSGKSTIIALLERFYDPLSGSILLDGVDIRVLQLCWLRSHVGLVSQEPVLFNMSIRENICLGKEGDVPESEVVEAARAANIHEFVSSLPDAYNTLVGERGVQLSGGQKQRVAIARAVIKDPRVLLLDEATSALDAESEHVVQEALDRVMVGRTTVVIAHRLSTVRDADVIAVMQRGRVVEQGRHEELLGVEGGVYASLVKLQSVQEEQEG